MRHIVVCYVQLRMQFLLYNAFIIFSWANEMRSEVGVLSLGTCFLQVFVDDSRAAHKIQFGKVFRFNLPLT